MKETRFKDTEIGKVPADWEVKTLGEVAPLQRGFDLPTDKLHRGVIPVVYSNGICNYHNKGMCQAPGLITGRSGTIGKFTFIPNGLYWPHNTTLWVTTFNGNDPKFIYYLYSSLKFEFYSGGSGVPTLNRNNLHETLVAIPSSLSEQRRIAGALSGVDKLISCLDKKIEKKKLIKQGAMQLLLTGKKRLQGFEGEWKSTKLKDIGRTYSGLSGKSKNDFGQGKSHYITFLNVLNNVSIDINQLEVVNVRPFEKQNAVHEGDLFFNTSSETPEEVGMCSALLYNVDKTYLNSFCFGFRLYNMEAIDSLFMAYWFKSQLGRNLMTELAQGSTRYNLSKESFLESNIFIPFYPEQRAIASVLTSIDEDIAKLEVRRDKYKQVKQGMMQQLLTGRIRLVDTETMANERTQAI